MRIALAISVSLQVLGLLGLGAGGLLAAEPAAQPGKAVSLFDDPVVARGNGFEVRQSEVDDMVTGLKSTLASTRNETIPEAQRSQIAAQMLDRLILTRIVQQRATADEQAKAKEIAAKFIADTKAKARSEEAYRRQLIASGIKPEVFERRAIDQALVEGAVERELKAKLTVSDEQVKEFYTQGLDLQARDILAVLARLEKENQTNTTFYTDGQQRLSEVKKTNLDKLERPESVKAQVILIYTVDRLTREELPEEEWTARKERAEKAILRLKAGEDFSKVAKEVSEDPDVARTGGEYVTIRDAVVYPELRAALFSLPVGQLSDVLTTRAGYYVAKVLERSPAGKVPLDKVEKDLREALLGQEVQKRLPAYFEELKKEFKVTYPMATNAPSAK